MYKGKTVFLQPTDYPPRRQLRYRRLAKRYSANHRVQRFLAAFVLEAGELSRGHTPRTRGSLHT